MCAAYTDADSYLTTFNNGGGSILSLCGQDGVDEIAEFPWSDAINGYLSLGRQFRVRLQQIYSDFISSSDGSSSLEIDMAYAWTFKTGSSSTLTPAERITELGETPDPSGWRPAGYPCVYYTMLEEVAGTYSYTDTGDGTSVSGAVIGFETTLPDVDNVPLLLETPEFIVQRQPNTGQGLMPIPQDGFAWVPFQLQPETSKYTSVIEAIVSQPDTLDLSFAEFSTPIPGTNDATHLQTCDQLKAYARFLKGGGSVSSSGESGGASGSRSLTLAVGFGTNAFRRYAFNEQINDSRGSFVFNVVDNLTETLEIIEPCEPGSNIYTLPPIDCGVGGGPNRIAVSCVGEVPPIAYDPSTRPTGPGEPQFIRFGDFRYFPLSTTTTNEALTVQWVDHACELVRLAPPCMGNAPAYPYRIADVPPGKTAFRVGEETYRVEGGAFSSRVPLPVDEWLDECPMDEFFLATKCRAASAGPPTVRYRRVDGLEPGAGKISVLVNITTGPQVGCVQVTKYQPTDTPTTDMSLLLAAVVPGTPCIGGDVIRCPNDTPTQIDLDAICAFCATNPPGFSQICGLLCNSRLTNPSLPSDPAVRAHIEAQRRASGCRSCGDPGGSELM
jgi:hypothetical protein